ncbi:hypothetical protein CHKEEEPN_1216 [Methylorubrum podarium]|nr:hypothetical protein CHKEEEPN_1216 [Methylorubrum podarium]
MAKLFASEMAERVCSDAISEAKSLAIAASLWHGDPASRRRAALSTSCRAASIRVAMSARRNATA